MPTQADLTELAKVLYNSSSDHPIGRLDASKASSMGFTGSEFYVWSGEVYGSGIYSGSAYARYFFRYGISSMNMYYFLRSSTMYAVCLGD